MNDTLKKLQDLILERKEAPDEKSYVATLFKAGNPKIGRKLVEEATETLIAAMCEGKDNIKNEAADLMFHLMVLLAFNNVSVDDVLGELEKRMGISGLDEKAARDARNKGK